VDSPYAGLVRVADEQRAHSFGSKLIAVDADAVAKVVEDVVTSENPPARVVVGAVTKFLVQLRRLMGSREFDAFLRRQHRGA